MEMGSDLIGDSGMPPANCGGLQGAEDRDSSSQPLQTDAVCITPPGSMFLMQEKTLCPTIYPYDT